MVRILFGLALGLTFVFVLGCKQGESPNGNTGAEKEVGKPSAPPPPPPPPPPGSR